MKIVFTSSFTVHLLKDLKVQWKRHYHGIAFHVQTQQSSSHLSICTIFAAFHVKAILVLDILFQFSVRQIRNRN